VKGTFIAVAVLAAAGLIIAPAITASAQSHQSQAPHQAQSVGAGYHDPVCASANSLCADPYQTPNGKYVGHDEPSVEYKSGVPGSGNDMTYVVTLPRDPKRQPNATGVGGSTWNFELRPTFWLGLTLCDTESAPEFTKTCAADSDSNNLVGANPASSDYIGKHPGTAFMELQFYGPGYVPQFEGFGCAATVYCAAMTIDSRTQDQNTGTLNTAACNNYILGGQEPINWAYVTKSGVSQGPANPLFTGTFSAPNLTAVNPDLSKDLLMNPGDRIRVHLHDTTAGLRADLTDLSTGQSGSMTASVANGFGHILFTPNSTTCQEAPYAFHPAYSTANPRGNTWTAHTYNVAFSDEIGHFENCLQIDANGNCLSAGSQDSAGLDPDDTGCVPGTDSTVVKIDGCFSPDGDYDGQSYLNDWPGTNPIPGQDRKFHPSPVMFTSPLMSNGKNFSTVAFETDLPRIEASDSQTNPPFCDTATGANCVNPPNGAQFYPFFSTAKNHGSCTWQEGGRFIPHTVNDFGGSSVTEFGSLLQTLYPVAGFTTVLQFDNFNSGDMANPCPVKGRH
jgi:hypothetical protein